MLLSFGYKKKLSQQKFTISNTKYKRKLSQQKLMYLTNIAERVLFGSWVMKSETVVFGSEFVGVVDTVVTVDT